MFFGTYKQHDIAQLDTKTMDTAYDTLVPIFNDSLVPSVVVIEDYRVYGYKSDEHKWAELHTAKLIGMIIGLCRWYELPWYMRMAQPAKVFVTDDKLKAWDMYVKGKRHGRDATRHALFHMIFGPSKDASEKLSNASRKKVTV